jgi:hypothetical protein
MTYQEQVDWCIEQHRKTNHLYDGYLPYEFHLRGAHRVFERFGHLLEEEMFVVHNPDNNWQTEDATRLIVSVACWGHDLIEDTRVSFNDVREATCYDTANIIYTLTNEKGRNRRERANAKYYEGIRTTPGALFVKLCDRIANVEYAKYKGVDPDGRSLFSMYEKENEEFMKSLGYTEDHRYAEMFEYLKNLFN